MRKHVWWQTRLRVGSRRPGRTRHRVRLEAADSFNGGRTILGRIRLGFDGCRLGFIVKFTSFWFDSTWPAIEVKFESRDTKDQTGRTIFAFLCAGWSWIFCFAPLTCQVMSAENQPDTVLIDRIREGDSDAWSDLIARYEGRLLAFAESRLRRREVSEDVVQEAFIGFLNSLPNYDGSRPLESYLFTICAHKLTDHLRKEGRRPTIPLSSASGSGDGEWQIPGQARPASSIARSGERKNLEEQALSEALQSQFEHWKQRADWTKIKCIELLFVRGRANKKVAELLDLTEQQVANYKFDFLAKMRNHIKRQGLSQDIFPELYETESS